MVQGAQRFCAFWNKLRLDVHPHASFWIDAREHKRWKRLRNMSSRMNSTDYKLALLERNDCMFKPRWSA